MRLNSHPIDINNMINHGLNVKNSQNKCLQMSFYYFYFGVLKFKELCTKESIYRYISAVNTMSLKTISLSHFLARTYTHTHTYTMHWHCNISHHDYKSHYHDNNQTKQHQYHCIQLTLFEET
jgi:hypothetical protein